MCRCCARPGVTRPIGGLERGGEGEGVPNDGFSLQPIYQALHVIFQFLELARIILDDHLKE